jgi:hypothetical protein
MVIFNSALSPKLQCFLFKRQTLEHYGLYCLSITLQKSQLFSLKDVCASPVTTTEITRVVYFCIFFYPILFKTYLFVLFMRTRPACVGIKMAYSYQWTNPGLAARILENNWAKTTFDDNCTSSENLIILR